MRDQLGLQLAAAAPALCELLEHRPTLLQDLPLGPKLLLDAIGLTTGRTRTLPLAAETEAAIARLHLSTPAPPLMHL